MPQVHPFRALRPKSEFAAKVSAKSSDFGSQNLLAEEMRSNPFTWHHVTKNHLNHSGPYEEQEKFLPYAARFVQEMKDHGILVKDNEESFYIYEQVNAQGRKFKGIIGLCSLEDYRTDRIRKHEAIRPSRLKFLVELFKTTKVMGEPTLLAHPEPLSIDDSSAVVVCNYTSIDGKHHIIKRLSNTAEILRIAQQFEAMQHFYIADGHHRSASIDEFHNQYPSLHNDKSLCLIVQEDQLSIKPFHRLIRPVMGIDKEEVLQKLSQKFTVSEHETDLYDPEQRHDFGMYLEGRWYKLVSLEKPMRMDVEILEEDIIRNIFRITDSRVDSQVGFHPYAEGVQSLVNLVDSKTFDVAFTTMACDFSEVRAVSELHHVLPAKSTYIEPKLRSGMIIQEFY